MIFKQISSLCSSLTFIDDLNWRKNNWFVTGTFGFVTGKNQNLSRALLQICKNCHGHFSFFTGIFLAFLSRATSQFSRAKFGVFCHGHFFKITGTFSKSVTGKPKNVTGEKNTGVVYVRTVRTHMRVYIAQLCVRILRTCVRTLRTNYARS